MTCRWDHDRDTWLRADGEPCRWDDDGQPTRHCTARRSCAMHVYGDELTCARCVDRTRRDLRQIADLAALMLPEALTAGVNSEAANLAGPAADPRAWRDRRIAKRLHLDTWLRLARISERQWLHARTAMEDDDEQHPYTVTTRWQMMLAEDYAHPLPAVLTTAEAVAYLSRYAGKVANDPDQDWSLFAREVRSCRSHLEAVLHNSRAAERGAPCAACRQDNPDAPAPRLLREYGHWCVEEDCDQLHYLDTSGDRWVCPRDRTHRWSEDDYRRWVADWHDDARHASA